MGFGHGASALKHLWSLKSEKEATSRDTQLIERRFVKSRDAHRNIECDMKASYLLSSSEVESVGSEAIQKPRASPGS